MRRCPAGVLPVPGDTLVTTIDADVQAAAEEALAKGIDLAHSNGNYAANGGAAVVLDVNSGQVLAMASYPTFDPDVFVGGISTKDYKKYSSTRRARTTRCSTARSRRPWPSARPSRSSTRSPPSRRA